MTTQLKNVASNVSRWRILAEIRRRRQILASTQSQRPSQHLPHGSSSSSASVSDLYEETLFAPSQPQRSTVSSLPPPTPAAQKVLSLLQQQNQPPSVALSESSFQPSAQDLASLLDHLSENQQVALQTLLWSLRHSNFVVSPLIPSRVENLLPPPRPVSVDKFLADAHAFWMQPELAMPPSLLDPLLSLYCHAAASIDETIELLNTMIIKGGNANVHHYNRVLQSAVSKQHNRVDTAQWLFNHMRKSGPSPNVISYNILIYGYCETGNAVESLHLFNEMISKGLPANDATYSNLISCVVKASDLDKALQLLQEMKYNGLHPSADTYNAIIGGLCAKGFHQMAASLIGDVRSQGLGLEDGTYQGFVATLSQSLGVPEAEAQKLLNGESNT